MGRKLGNLLASIFSGDRSLEASRKLEASKSSRRHGPYLPQLWNNRRVPSVWAGRVLLPAKGMFIDDGREERRAR